uniref:Uncharacterized protein n=1 Tax=Oryza brachyantha TaxID=4533 RepID=J3LR40_ORYBR
MDVNGALVNWSCTANSPGLHACRDATLGQYFTNTKLISSYLGSYYYYPKFYRPIMKPVSPALCRFPPF